MKYKERWLIDYGDGDEDFFMTKDYAEAAMKRILTMFPTMILEPERVYFINADQEDANNDNVWNNRFESK